LYRLSCYHEFDEKARQDARSMRSAAVSRWVVLLSIVSAVAAMLSGFGTRAGWWHFRTGFQILTWAAYAGLGAAMLGCAVVLLAWRTRQRGAAVLGLIAILVGLTSVGIPWEMKRTARRVPAIHDISTDTDDPPLFDVILPLRKDAPNTADYGGQDIAAQQRAAYPDVNPLLLRMPSAQAFAAALHAAEAMGWVIVAANPIDGRLEATDTTFWFGFKDDIVVRIRPQPEGSRIDVRSVSRVGKSDVGTNARRIREFLRRVGRAA
jgi:uncharacterized protein (DUF1499 family)